MSINLETCYECFNTFEESLRSVCPVCEVKREMEEKIEFLNGQIENLKEQVDEALCGVQEARRSRPVG